jgi:Secretion system C-terminal sorting domain
MKYRVIVLLILIASEKILGQGFYNHAWLLGSYIFPTDPKGRIMFDSTGYTHYPETRKMPFWGTEATICDKQGDFLMSTNGIWIANSNNDTMLNGGGLSPSYLTQNWAFGIPLGYGATFLPFPGDSTKYILFHLTRLGQFAIDPTELDYSIIDISGDNGFGEVISKNNILIADTLSWGITACKHANGRDWWIVIMQDGNPATFTYLLTPTGINTMVYQDFNIPTNTYGNVSQIMFSENGEKFAYVSPDSQNTNGYLIICDFDRCTGVFSNVQKQLISSSNYLYGLCFSPNNKFLYTCTSSTVFQFEIDSLTIDTVATYDGFISPPGQSCCATSFWNMYLAANGKIYITSGSGVQHLHEMNYPDSAGLACDVQQHSISLGYAQLRAVPNHPNYNLGPIVGSVCDTLSVGLTEVTHDFHFSIAPNPVSDRWVKLTYLLPQNKAGVFEVYDLTGQQVYSQRLPPWSTLQYVQLPALSNGLYSCVIRSGNERVAKKLVVMR